MKKFMILFFAAILLFAATACLDEAEDMPGAEGPPPVETDTLEPDSPEESLSAEETAAVPEEPEEPEEPEAPGETDEPEVAGPVETAIAAGDVMAQMAGNWVAWYEMNPANALFVNLFADGRWESPGPLPTDMDLGGSFVIAREEAGIYHLKLTIEHTCDHPASVHVEIGSEFGSEIQYDSHNDRLGTVLHSGEGSWIEWFRRA